MAEVNETAPMDGKIFKVLETKYGKLRVGSSPDATEIELCVLDENQKSGCSITIYHSGETAAINPRFTVNDAHFMDEVGKEPFKLEGVAHQFAAAAKKVLLGNPTQEDAENLGKLTAEIQRATIRQRGEPLPHR